MVSGRHETEVVLRARPEGHDEEGLTFDGDGGGVNEALVVVGLMSHLCREDALRVHGVSGGLKVHGSFRVGDCEMSTLGYASPMPPFW